MLRQAFRLNPIVVQVSIGVESSQLYVLELNLHFRVLRSAHTLGETDSY